MRSKIANVNKAHSLYKNGNYREAKLIYEKLAQMYGKSLFEINLKLCDKRNGAPISIDKVSKNSEEPKSIEPVSLSTQLKSTQRLLEYYYSKYKTLEKLLKGKTK